MTGRMRKMVKGIKRSTFHFQKFSKKQRMVLNWWCGSSPVKDNDGIIADGAIRSGKTLCMSLSFVMWAMESFDGQNLGMCGKTIGSFRRNVLFWLKLMLVSRGYGVRDCRADNLVIITKGSRVNYFYIFGGKDERSQDLIQGITLAGCFFDEVALMPESFVNQATGRCSVDGSKFWFNCNPDGPYHWFKTNWVDKRKDKKLLYLHFTMDDNLSLSGRIKERYRNMYRGVFFKRYILGMWVVAEGIIYDMFEKEKHVISSLENLTGSNYYVSCDYGTQNPTAFLLWCRDNAGRWVCCREYYYSGRDEDSQKTDSEYADDLEKWLDGIKPVKIVADPSAASLIAELKKRGYNVKKAKNDVLDGIRYTASLLALGKIAIHKGCKNTIKEFASYMWDEKAAERGEDKPVKQHDHCLTGDTLIDTPGGQIAIRDLVGKNGKVYCYDTRRKKKTISEFSNVRMTQRNAVVYEIILEDGTKIKATAEHPVYTSRGWVVVKDLKRSDKILKLSCQEQNTVHYVKIKNIKETGKEKVYNMEVKNHHNFSICGGFIVHNCMDALRYMCYTIIRKPSGIHILK